MSRLGTADFQLDAIEDIQPGDDRLRVEKLDHAQSKRSSDCRLYTNVIRFRHAHSIGGERSAAISGDASTGCRGENHRTQEAPEKKWVGHAGGPSNTVSLPGFDGSPPTWTEHRPDRIRA